MSRKTILYSRNKSPMYLLEPGQSHVKQYESGHVERVWKPGRVARFKPLAYPIPTNLFPTRKVTDPDDPEMTIRGAQGILVIEDEAKRLDFPRDRLLDFFKNHSQRGVDFEFVAHDDTPAEVQKVAGEAIIDQGNGTYYCEPCQKVLQSKSGMMVHIARSGSHKAWLESKRTNPQLEATG